MKTSAMFNNFLYTWVMSWCAIASAADKPVIASAAQQQVGARGGCEIVIYSMTNCSGCTDLKNEIFIDGDPGKGPKPGYACNTVTYKDCGDRGLKCRSSLPEGCRTPDPKNPGSKVLQFPCSVVNGAPHRGYSPANGNTRVHATRRHQPLSRPRNPVMKLSLLKHHLAQIPAPIHPHTAVSSKVEKDIPAVYTAVTAPTK
jgi:hypothetical protein